MEYRVGVWRNGKLQKIEENVRPIYNYATKRLSKVRYQISDIYYKKGKIKNEQKKKIK